jgi:thiamine biosynthesis lipoprotein
MELHRLSFRAMGSPCELRLYGGDETPEVLAAAQAEVARLEAKYSRYRDDSLATRINRSAGDAAGVEVDAETAHLLDYADACHRQSYGLFDVSSGILRRAWNLKSGKLPAQAEIDALLPLVGWTKLRWRAPRIVLPLAGMQLDFGGYVKEYTADRVAELMRRHGARHGLVDLGGDLSIVGPHPDGAPWQVGIRDPHDGSRALRTLLVYGGGVATSGDYERGMWVDGVRYSHLLDPRSGWPVDGPASVTVLATHCLIAGTASSIAMLSGRAGADAWLARVGLPFLRVDRDGGVAERWELAGAA